VGCGGRDCVSGFRRRALDHRCEHSGRRWVKALGAFRCGYFRDELSGVACARRRGGSVMSQTKQERNKALVLEAFDTLFNKRDYVAAERYWSPSYIQHSAHIAPGREGLFDLIKGMPPTLKYEPGVIVADGDFVIVHGRFSGFGAPVNWIAADILRIEDGILVEHWDVIQDEATEEQSKSKAPMFGSSFPVYAASEKTI